MSFRTVIINSQSRLTYKNRLLSVKNGLEEKYVHISEIDTLLIDSISVSISSYLLKELIKSKVNIIFFDEKRNPFGELISLYSSHNTSKKIINQTKWTKQQKDLLWQEIIRNKICNQMFRLKKQNNNNYELFVDYIANVQIGDKSNREGHAAKVYFNNMYGSNFVRHRSDDINKALNYGYAILLSTINKEVINNGYITQLGIHHKNEFNQFNLSCDLMEVFRCIIDQHVYLLSKEEFNKDYKYQLVGLFNEKYQYLKKFYTLKDIIKLYVKNCFEYLENNKQYKGFNYEE